MPNGVETAGLSVFDLSVPHFAMATGRAVSERLAYFKLLDLLEEKGTSVVTQVPSPYGGSREGTFINDAAFKELQLGRTRRMYNGFALIHDIVMEGRPVSNAVTDAEVERHAVVSEATVPYVLLRPNGVGWDNVPTTLGNMHKAALGFRDLARRNLLLLNDPQIYHSGREVYNRAEEIEVFRRPEAPRFSCAANEPVIVGSAEALLFGRGADASKSELPEIIDPNEFPNLLAFAESLGDYSSTQMALRLGVISPDEGVDVLELVQQAMNESLGRDPKRAPAVERSQVKTLAGGRPVMVQGGIIDRSVISIDTELAAVRRAALDRELDALFPNTKTTPTDETRQPPLDP